MSRILYISHDIAQPRGGIGVLYDHVAALREHGLDAFIVHATPGFRYPFAGADIPVIDASHLGVSRTDVLVVPEDHAAAIRKCREMTGRKVLLCQNHLYVFHGLTPGETWRNFGFSAYMCVSSPIQHALMRWFGVDASVVRPAVNDVFFSEDLKPFAPPITAACMPRKGPHNIRLVQGLLAASGHVHGKNLSWVEIEGLSKDQVAARLRDAHVYVSTSVHEGLGLPPLEAMAAGCLVVGFAGGGGLDYATAENGIWVPDEDPWALAEAVKKSADALAAGSLSAMRAAGQKTAACYSRAAFEERLLAFWHEQFRMRGL